MLAACVCLIPKFSEYECTDYPANLIRIYDHQSIFKFCQVWCDSFMTILHFDLKGPIGHSAAITNIRTVVMSF